MKRVLSKFLIGLACVGVAAKAEASRIVALHDEWAFTDTAFANAGNASTTAFTLNMASFLKGSTGAGNYLIFSDSLAFTEGSLFNQTLQGAGHNTVFMNSTIGSLPLDLSLFDGVFVSGNQSSSINSALTNYVNNGGGVAVLAGNSWVDDVEANRHNSFLANFGLAFENTYNGLQGVFDVTGTHSLLNGVDRLYYDNGNNVLKLTANNPFASIIESFNGQGMIGVYDTGSTSVPEPTSLLLLAAGGAGLVRKRRTAQRA